MPEAGDASPRVPRSAALALGAVLLAFAITRSLTPEPLYFLGVDEPVYLGLAAKLPHYSLYGGAGFVNHPPLFPVLIRLVATVVSLPLAGLLVALGMQALTGWLLWRLLRGSGFGPVAIGAVLALLVLSSQWHRLAGIVYKETTYVACVFGLLGSWLAGARGQSRSLGAAAAWAVATVAASDYSIFAVAGCQAGVAAQAFSTQRWRVRLLLPAVAGAIAYIAWLGWRLQVYRSAPEVAVGIGGVVEATGRIGLRQLLTPQALPLSAALTGVRTSWPGSSELLNLVYGVFEFGPLRWIWYARGPFLPLALMPAGPWAILGIGWLTIESVRGGDAERRGFARALLVLALFLCIPATQEIVRNRPRMFLALPAIAAVGVVGAAAAVGRRFRLGPRAAARTVCLLLLAGTGVAVWALPHVVWFRPLRVEAQAAADWLNARPPTAIMSQIGYSQELGWLTPHQVFGLPVAAAAVRAQVDRYGIRYLVYGTHYWRSPDDAGNRRPVWNGEAIATIRAHPERYPLLATLTEVYVPPHRGLTGDTLWIHGVVRPAIDGTQPSP